MGKKRVNRNRIPTTIVEARAAGIKKGTAQGIVLMFTALLDCGLITQEQIDPLGERVEYLIDSIEKGYINIADLVKTLHTDYEIRFE